MAKKDKDSSATKIQTDEFIYDGKNQFLISEASNRIKPLYQSKKDYRKQLAAMVAEIDELQAVMNAQNRHGLLLVFQAMDAAGKDGTIRRLLSGVNPAGCLLYTSDAADE